MPIPQEVNTLWQDLLRGTPWQYYRLNVTQWVGPAEGNPNKLVAFPQNDDGVSILRDSVLETYLMTWNNQKTVTTGMHGLIWKRGVPIDPKSIASQVFIDRVTDLDAANDLLLDYEIPATFELDLPKPEGAAYRGTWSSCVVCHQLADWEASEGSERLKVSIDMSFLFKSFLQDVQPKQ